MNPTEKPRIPGTEIVKDWSLMALVFVVVYLVLRPLQNTPFHDDWIYAWRVQWLLDNGQLRTLEYSSNPNFVQVLWGALFCLPFGFSFIALRLSTGVLGLWALWGQYLLLRELNVSRRDAWIGTAVLGFNPIFFLLTFTFMTEVPFLCAMIWACYAFVRAIRRKSTPWLVVAILISCLSLGVRAVGIVLPFAASCALFFHTGKWGRERLRYLYPMITPVVLAGLLLVMYGTRIQRGTELRDHLPLLWRTISPSVAYAGACFGLWLLPLTIGLFRRREVRLASIHFVWVTALMVMAVSEKDFTKRGNWPLFGEAFWKASELGHITGGLLDYPTIPLSYGLLWTATIVMSASFSYLLAASWYGRREQGEQFLLWLTGGQILLVALIWLIYDRYLLTLAPLGIALALSGKAIRRPVWAWGFVALLAIAALVGTRDHLAYNRALWQGINDLRHIAPDDQIDAGYVPNHWLQYRHVEFGHGKPPRREPYRYQISTSPQSGTRELKTIPYTRWLGPSGVFHLLERD